jgi:radical SAM-linked protein
MREFILRAMRLAGLKVRYSQGNTPRPKVSFSPACPTGVQSEAEYMDVDCLGDADARAVAEQLRPYLPDGVFIINGEEIGSKSPSINSALVATSYVANFDGALEAEELRAKVNAFMEASSVLVKVIRKSKGRFLDARENVLDAAVVGQSLHVKLSFTNNGATMKIFEAIGSIVGADIARDAHVTKVSAEIGDESLGAPPIQPLVVEEDCVEVIDLTSLSVRARQAEKLGGKTRGSAILVPYSE